MFTYNDSVNSMCGKWTIIFRIFFFLNSASCDKFNMKNINCKYCNKIYTWCWNFLAFFLNSFVLFCFMWQFNQSNYKLQLKHCKLYTWCCKFSGMLKWNVLLPSGCWHIEKQGGVRQVHIWNPFLRTRSQEEKTTTARHIVPVAMITSCSWTHLRAHDTISKKEVTDSGTVPWNRLQ